MVYSPYYLHNSFYIHSSFFLNSFYSFSVITFIIACLSNNCLCQNTRIFSQSISTSWYSIASLILDSVSNNSKSIGIYFQFTVRVQVQGIGYKNTLPSLLYNIRTIYICYLLYIAIIYSSFYISTTIINITV